MKKKVFLSLTAFLFKTIQKHDFPWLINYFWQDFYIKKKTRARVRRVVCVERSYLVKSLTIIFDESLPSDVRSVIFRV